MCSSLTFKRATEHFQKGSKAYKYSEQSQKLNANSLHIKLYHDILLHMHHVRKKLTLERVMSTCISVFLEIKIIIEL